MKQYLHYIGNGLYSINAFKKEAIKYGVNRAIPKQIAAGMQFGDVVYLAIHKVKYGKSIAHIFGKFVISGISSDNIDYSKLQVKIIEGEPERIERKCGSYTISVRATTKSTLKECVEACNGKIFITGQYFDLENPIEIFASFSRGYTRIEHVNGMEYVLNDATIFQIKNYEQIH